MSKWSEYKELEGIYFQAEDFRQTLDGGQAFTWFEFEKLNYIGTFSKYLLKLKLNNDGKLYYAYPKSLENNPEEALLDYLDAHTNYENIRTNFAKINDPILNKAMQIYPTLRILKQCSHETIISFICSSSKRIIQIKQCVNLLSKALGKHIADDFYSIPSLSDIANADIEIIKECKLGFRANYLKNSALKIVEDNFNPELLRDMKYSEAKQYLNTLNGIGDKIADCILLFGGSKFQAFPVDTWIKQAMVELYSTPSNADKIRDFAKSKFGENAGFAQQLIFSAKRNALI